MNCVCPGKDDTPGDLESDPFAIAHGVVASCNPNQTGAFSNFAQR
jgi:hypothetical protein